MKLIFGLFLMVVLSAFASAKAAVNGNAGGLVGFWFLGRVPGRRRHVLRACHECRGSIRRPE